MLPILSLCRFEDFKNLYICLQIAIKEKGVCKLQLKIRGYAGAWSIFEFQTLNIYQNLCIKWTASLILSDLPCKDMALLDLQQYYLNKIWRKKHSFLTWKVFIDEHFLCCCCILQVTFAEKQQMKLNVQF